jgi:phospholipid/cholesterol/gamma-HCH transport system substrate-binding protein
MRPSRAVRRAVALALVLVLAGGITAVVFHGSQVGTTRIVGYFDNSNGIYTGDDVLVLGVRVGKIERIEPEPMRTKITFAVDEAIKIPADAKAVVISPTLVTARAIQLTPVYTGGPTMSDGAIIPEERTAVPLEFDDLRKQLDKLTQTLQPTQPGGQSTLGEFISTAADNLRGRGADIRDTLIKVSQAFSALGDHSGDIFGTLKNLAILTSALRSSTDLLRELNGNLASVTGLLSEDPDAVADATRDLNTAMGDVASFVAENREPMGTASDKLTSISTAVIESLDDVKQTLHITPTAFQNLLNIYHPSMGALTGALSANNFADPISFVCGAIQAASRLNAEQAAKLCVQYLAPIVKNRAYNFFPLGGNPFSGPIARPNEVTFSEDWLRPLTEPGRVRDAYEGPLPGGYQLPPGTTPPVAAPIGAPANGAPLDNAASANPDANANEAGPPALPAEATTTDPASGLPGLMVPPGGGS